MIVNMNGKGRGKVPEPPDYQERTTQATAFPVVVTPDTGYDALSKVTVTVPSNMTAGNIKDGVNIAGVIGTYAPKVQTKAVQATTFPVALLPDPGYDGLSKATVNAPQNLSAGNIRAGVSIAGVTGTFEGSTELQEKSVRPTTFPVTVTADNDYDGLSAVTVTKPDDLVASNIPYGVEICGVSGSWQPRLQLRNVTPTYFPYPVTAQSGYDALSQVNVNKPSNLVAANIKEGVTIAGVTGTYDPDTGTARSVSLGSSWPCIQLSGSTTTGTSTTVEVGRLYGPRTAVGAGGGGKCCVAIPVVNSESMSMTCYQASMSTGTSAASISTYNSAMDSLFDLVDDIVGSTSWTATCYGVFQAYDQGQVICAASAGTTMSCTITKSGTKISLKPTAAYTVKCFSTTAQVYVGFYPTAIYVS